MVSNNFIKILKKKTRAFSFYINYLNKITLKNTNNKKQIIIIFDGKFQHGGLVDRLKGIVSFYQISEKLNADFKIYFKHPFDLEFFFNPNSYNWKSSESDLRWNPLKTKVLYFMDDFKSNPYKIIKSSNKNKIIVFANIDYSKSIYPDLNIFQHQTKWKESFDVLFKKTLFLELKIKSLKIVNESIAIHTRFTSILGDFKDASINEVSNERKIEIINELKHQIIEIEKQSNFKDIYIFSDSLTFLDNIKRTTKYKTIDGIPKHIDFDNNKNDIKDVHLKTFVDFFAISEIKTVCLLKTKEMYNSSFSKYAAIVGGNEFILK
jgi:hypothetical protein